MDGGEAPSSEVDECRRAELNLGKKRCLCRPGQDVTLT